MSACNAYGELVRRNAASYNAKNLFAAATVDVVAKTSLIYEYTGASAGAVYTCTVYAAQRAQPKSEQGDSEGGALCV